MGITKAKGRADQRFAPLLSPFAVVFTAASTPAFTILEAALCREVALRTTVHSPKNAAVVNGHFKQTLSSSACARTSSKLIVKETFAFHHKKNAVKMCKPWMHKKNKRTSRRGTAPHPAFQRSHSLARAAAVGFSAYSADYYHTTSKALSCSTVPMLLPIAPSDY